MVSSTKVLKILDRNVVFSEPVKSVLLESGEVALPGIGNSLGVFVHKTKQNEKYLSETGHCYVSGFLMKLDGQELFQPDDDRMFLQMVLEEEEPNLGVSLLVPQMVQPEVGIPPSGLVQPSASFTSSASSNTGHVQSRTSLFEGVEQVVLLATLLNQKLYSYNKFLHAIPVPIRSGGFSFELFHKKKGQARGVYLITPKLGMTRLVLHKDYGSKTYRVVLESKIPTISLTQGR